MSSKAPLIAVACLIAALAGFGIYSWHSNSAEAAAERARAAVTPKPLKDGDAAPANLKLVDLQGNSHSLEDYRGKLVIVNFWATWCGPCLHEIPSLVKAQADYAARGVQFLGPAVDEVEDVRKQAPGLKFNYPVLVSDSEDMLALLSRFGNTEGGLPFSVVISPEGRIVDRQLGEFSGAELAGLIEDHLAKTK
jgi:thiol-disulfide isomerase/thioredoxin